MTHKGRAVADEQFQRLAVGQMPFAAADAVFQRPGIPPLFQQLLVIIGFEKGGMAYRKMLNKVFADLPDGGKNADTNGVSVFPLRRNDEIMRVDAIMRLGTSAHIQ